ncbi:MAG: hypothetical protein JSV25_01975 [Spirochaetota bacterium]|nr:MAG: hypothetical protein JSV25_01975 [Spirochaetota bacterium]
MFDEQFFMYFEDTDRSRRIHRKYRMLYYPYSSIYYDYDRIKRKKMWLLSIHIKSAIKYFNKWGWFFDRERDDLNLRIMEQLIGNAQIARD